MSVELFRNDGSHRVVITGMGAVTPLGYVDKLWDGLKNGKSGITQLQTILTDHVPIKIGGEVRDFIPAEYGINPKDARRMGRATHFVLASTKMALEHSTLSQDQIDINRERVGVSIGTSFGAHELGVHSTFAYKSSEKRIRPNPLELINSLPNMPAYYISKFFNTLGPSRTVSATCASGTQSIGEGMDLIRYGRCDVVITGGVESIIQDYSLATFNATGVLATGFDYSPTQASRPFDANRTGFVYSEGAGIVIIESMKHAIERGAEIYAEILGYGTAGDAYHIISLDPEGKGPILAIKNALFDAQLDVQDIQYINAHGTSTLINDAVETSVIKQIFGDRAYHIPISSTKSMIGHSLGGSGAIELIACVMTLKEQVIHPTINYEYPDSECDLDYVPNEARNIANLRYIMSNSFGIGGQNASIIIGKL